MIATGDIYKRVARYITWKLGPDAGAIANGPATVLVNPAPAAVHQG